MPAVFEFSHKVTADEIDPMGHVNNVAYVLWMQSAAVEHSTAQGWSGPAYRERGWAWVARSHRIEYRRPALLEDDVVVRTWVASMERFTSLRKYEMYRGRDLLARAETNWAFVDFTNQKLLAIPAEVAGAFEIHPGRG